MPTPAFHGYENFNNVFRTRKVTRTITEDHPCYRNVAVVAVVVLRFGA